MIFDSKAEHPINSTELKIKRALAYKSLVFDQGGAGDFLNSVIGDAQKLLTHSRRPIFPPNFGMDLGPLTPGRTMSLTRGEQNHGHWQVTPPEAVALTILVHENYAISDNLGVIHGTNLFNRDGFITPENRRKIKSIFGRDQFPAEIIEGMEQFGRVIVHIATHVRETMIGNYEPPITVTREAMTSLDNEEQTNWTMLRTALTKDQLSISKETTKAVIEICWQRYQDNQQHWLNYSQTPKKKSEARRKSYELGLNRARAMYLEILAQTIKSGLPINLVRKRGARDTVRNIEPPELPSTT